MLDNKFFITIVCSLLAVFAFVSVNSNPTKEGFLNYGGIMRSFGNPITNSGTPQSSAVMNPIAASVSLAQSRLAQSQAQAGKYGVKKGDMYQVPPNFQASLSPRIYAGSYGANIQYDIPSYKNLAVPADPLTFGNMAKENFQGCKGGVGRGNGSLDSTKTIPPPGYTQGNYSDLQNALSGQIATSELPVGTMESVNAEGITQAFTVNNLMTYTSRSRIQSLGDQIRGDLIPVVNNQCGTAWFQTAASKNPTTVLKRGALQIMAGVNEASTSFNDSLTALNGGISTDAYASVNMSSQKDTTILGNARGISVTSFP
jgi:hypothetical protein